MQICLVARQLLDEAVERQQLEKNPASAVRGFSGEDETTHLALTDEQAQALLDSIPTNTLSGQRDYTMILLLLRRGIRRSEAPRCGSPTLPCARDITSPSFDTGRVTSGAL